MTQLTTNPVGLKDLQTPCLVLDEEKLQANLEMMGELTRKRDVLFRPHLKTAKSIEVAKLSVKEYGNRATVSTLKEAEIFSAAGLTDLLYAVAIAPQKLARVSTLRKQGIDLKIITDSVEMARAITAHGQTEKVAMPTLIELDLDGHRSGVRPEDSSRLIEIGSALGSNLLGVIAHAGQSYGLSDNDAIEQAAIAEANSAQLAARTLTDEGLPCPIISVGSTPTAVLGDKVQGITELRAGVYMFFDLVQSGVGVCTPENIALSVLATVISRDPENSKVVVDAGWMALSRDRGTASQAIDYGYGQVCSEDGRILPGILVLDAQQEHGIIGLRSGSDVDFPELAIGSRIRILPNHACATAAQFDHYNVVGKSGDIEKIWPRFTGW